MRIYCLSHYDLVQRRRTTNRLSDVRFCQGLARNGAEVELIVPYTWRPDNVPRRAVRDHYGVAEPLSITTLPTPLWKGAPRAIRVPTWWGAVLTKFAATRGRWWKGRPPSAWISRDHNATLATLLGRGLFRDSACTVVYWAHEFLPEDRRIAWLYRHVDGVLATNSAIRDDLEAVLGVSKDRTAVTLNPVPPELFATPPDRKAARHQLGLDQEVPVVVYTGKLGIGFEEVEHILEAAKALPDYRFVLTGGPREVVKHLGERRAQAGLENVRFTGWLDDWETVRTYQIAADVLVSYYTAKNKLLSYNYPQKITEYMASGTPVVTPQARATQDVLNTENAVFVEPHSSPALAAGIKRVIENPDYAQAVSQRAYRDARGITIEKRGREVLSFLGRIASGGT